MLASQIHYEKILNDNIEIRFIEVNSADKKFIYSTIDQYISLMVEGASGDKQKINPVKKDILKYFEKKKDKSSKIGYIAEFFIHLFLLQENYKMECILGNLEGDRDIKKGFDGYYTDSKGLEWIMESKSTLSSTLDSSHIKNVKISYNDIIDKLSNPNRNNPWKNAFNHFIISGSSSKLIDRLKTLKNNFSEGNFEKISEHNTIPVSTIFFDKTPISTVDISSFKSDLENYFKNKKYKKMIILCFDNSFYDLFFEYLNLLQTNEEPS